MIPLKLSKNIAQKFLHVWEKPVKELNAVAYMFKHKKTNAQVLYLSCSDENKTFAISFKTLPDSSNGIMHILEHLVLHGSKKYPVKDPMMCMMKTSMASFINAMTYPDKTIYPISSQNDKDFENLMDVYLDAVFNPLLTKEGFQTEGWCYQLKDENSTPTIEGVVYNEMKGSRSELEPQIYWGIVKNLFPDTNYIHDSGGLPDQITNLTYEELIAYHNTNYHPSNSQTVLYGNIDLNRSLEHLDSYFGDYELSTNFKSISTQPLFSESKIKSIDISVTAENKDKAHFAINYGVLNDPSIKEELILSLIFYCLFESEAASMREFLEKGKAESLLTFGYSKFLVHPFITYGAKGVKKGKIESLITEFEQLLQESFDNLTYKQLEAALNKLEFHLREPSTNNLGIHYMEEVFSTWNYNKDPLLSLYFQSELNELKDLNSNELINYAKQTFSKFVFENKHRVLIKFLPNENLLLEQSKREQDKILAFESSLTPEAKREQIQKTKYLLDWKTKPNSAEELKKLPSLKVSDLALEGRKVKSEVTKIKNVVLVKNIIETKGNIYLQFVFNINDIPSKLVPLLIVYLNTILKLGTKEHSYKDWAMLLEKITGGFGVSLNSMVNALNTDKEDLYFGFSAKMLASKFSSFVQALNELFLNPNFAQESRLRLLLSELKQDIEEALVSDGHEYALLRAQSGMSYIHNVKEQTFGISGLEYLKKILAEEKLGTLIDSLSELHSFIVNNNKLTINLGCSEEFFTSESKIIFEQLVNNLESTSKPEFSNSFADEFKPFVVDDRMENNTSINFVAQSVDLKKSGYNLDAGVLLLNRLITRDYLWENIRVKGGAYGAFGSIDMLSGDLCLSSYRDPNVDRTLQTFDGVFDYFSTVNLSQSELEGYIIGTVSKLDNYLRPEALNNLAFGWYLQNSNFDFRQSIRSRLLSLNQEKFRELLHVFAQYSGNKNATGSKSEFYVEAKNRFVLLAKS